jgi:cell division protein FtsB
MNTNLLIAANLDLPKLFDDLYERSQKVTQVRQQFDSEIAQLNKNKMALEQQVQLLQDQISNVSDTLKSKLAEKEKSMYYVVLIGDSFSN